MWPTATSSETGYGKEDLLAIIEQAITVAKEQDVEIKELI